MFSFSGLICSRLFKKNVWMKSLTFSVSALMLCATLLQTTVDEANADEQGFGDFVVAIQNFFSSEGKVYNYLDLNPQSDKFLHMFLPRVTGFSETNYDAILKFEDGFPYEFSVGQLTDAYLGLDAPFDHNFSEMISLPGSGDVGVHVPIMAIDTGNGSVESDINLILKDDYNQTSRLFVSCLYFDISNTENKFECGLNQPFTFTDYSISYESETPRIVVQPEFAISDHNFKAESFVYTIDGVKVSEQSFDGGGVSILEFSLIGSFIVPLESPLSPGMHELGIAAIHEDNVSYVAEVISFSIEEEANFEMDFSSVTGVSIGTNLVIETDGPSGPIDRNLFYDGQTVYGPISNQTTQSFDEFFTGSGSLAFTLSASGDAIIALNLSHATDENRTILNYVGSGSIPFHRSYNNRLEYKLSGEAVCDFLQTVTKEDTDPVVGYTTTGMNCGDNTSFTVDLRSDL